MLGEKAHLEICTKPSRELNPEESMFNVIFNTDESSIDVPEALLIENNIDKKVEFFLKTISLSVPSESKPVCFICNSWVYPAIKYGSSYTRVFFRNKSYIPSETPQTLLPYRKSELKYLKGNGLGERKEWDRIYDYDVYNDLGEPDTPNLARPTLGGNSEFPYPRRGRTGRPPTKTDPKCESRPAEGKLIYIPRDERADRLKESAPLSLAYRIKVFCSKTALHAPTVDQISAKSTAVDDEFNDFEQVFALFADRGGKYPTPHLIKGNKSSWMTDEEFARQMIAGVHPVHIRCLKEFPPTSKLDTKLYGDQTSTITEDHIKDKLEPEFTVENALEQNKLFILDHHDTFMPYLRKINESPTTKAYASRTILFLTSEGTLKPVAIELSLPPNSDCDKEGSVSKVYTPSEGGVEYVLWELAKAYVAVNDSGYHQLCSHWLNTHAVIEPFVIATNRQLSVLHPIHKLLQPHYRETMNINALARLLLVNAGGKLESLFFQGKYAMESSSAVYKDWVFTDQALPADLLKRGLAVKKNENGSAVCLVLEHYPYAVDGLEIWSAIRKWVEDYCTHYYASDDIVQKDTELQAWWKDVREVGHGDKKDEPWWPKMKTIDELVESCTILIWITSALHAAVNFGQYPFAAFFPNRPSLSRRLMPEEGSAEYNQLATDSVEKSMLLTITPKYLSDEGISLVHLLSKHTPDEVFLGNEKNCDWTSDANILNAFTRFGRKLAKIEKSIEDRNKDVSEKNRAGLVNFPYTLLIPTSEPGITARGIPNSISI
ncbi:linoleate 9S-lipoxygenase 6-like [Humulus lupulus]|uniref:linoleate 9S-lipoxygenase 6-like n=1 Tax=Humulus lupulus TaxID=3486 RepID=UPI002B40E8B9|nr:linoleate 9S-lipoxygenase 6-like [Humulus lupulus]